MNNNENGVLPPIPNGDPVVSPTINQEQPVMPTPAPTPIEPVQAPVEPAPIPLTPIPTEGDVPALEPAPNPLPAAPVNQSVNPTELQPLTPVELKPASVGAQNSIGDNPPPAAEIKEEMPSNKKKPSGIKKLLFILLILILMGGVAYGVYYYLSLGTQNKVTLISNKYEVGEALPTDISAYAKFNGVSAANCKLDTTKVDINKVGKHMYTITCGESVYTGEVEIVDTKAPTVTLNEVYAVIGEEIKIEDFIEACSEENCIYTYSDENAVTEALKTSGAYEINIKVADTGDNVTEVTGNLVVTESTLHGYVVATKEDTEKSDDKVTLTLEDKLAIGNSNKYLEYAVRSYYYKFANESDYTAAKEEIGTSNEYDGITGKISFDDVTKTVKVEVTLTRETLDLEAGGTFPDNFTDIRQLYQNFGYDTSTETKNG